MSGRLVHIGSAVVDYVYRIDALPAPGMEKTASSFAQVAGGGFNMMVAASRTGMQVVFGGQLGSGPNGDFLRAAFMAEGIATLTPPSPSMDSGNCVAMISSDAERTFVSWPGAESVLSRDLLAPVSVAPGDWVFASGYTRSYPGSRDALGRPRASCAPKPNRVRQARARAALLSMTTNPSISLRLAATTDSSVQPRRAASAPADRARSSARSVSIAASAIEPATADRLEMRGHCRG